MMGSFERDLMFPGNAENYFIAAQTWDERDVLPTPWPAINRTCGGWGGWTGIGPGWYVVCGGSSGGGKSLMALNMAVEGIRRGKSVGFVSLEMTAEQLQTRLYSMLCGVQTSHISPGRHFRNDVAEGVTRRVQGWRDEGWGKLFVNEDRIRNLHDVISLMRGWREGWGCEVMVVDYMQLCRVPGEDATHRRIQATSAEVCDFANAHQVPVIALSQFHSQARRDRTAPPTMDSLYGGVDLGNDADMVLLLDHTRYDRPTDDYARTWMVQGKNRHGPVAQDVPMEWDYRNLRLTEPMDDADFSKWPGAQL